MRKNMAIKNISIPTFEVFYLLKLNSNKNIKTEIARHFA